MAGAGPWAASPATLAQTDALITKAYESFGKPLKMREANSILGLQLDVMFLGDGEWRRDLGYSRFEFSRWGIQQIILINRLRYVKNPIMRRLIDVVAAYVFARGVEVSSPDPDANATLKDFFTRNAKVLGHVALVDLQRRKGYDGNLFFVLFSDKTNTGDVNIRTIDCTEIQEIATDPEDADTPWFYRRTWSYHSRDPKTGAPITAKGDCWYPARGYDPEAKPDTWAGLPVMWDSPVHHRKSGSVGKWHFGLPEMYPAGPWAVEAEKYLERCASVADALGEIARVWTTKGGQQAIEGIKQQTQTGTSPTGNLWDPNPTGVAGADFASGPGTTLQAFKTQGSGLDPEKVRQYKLQCCMVAGIPETFLGDVSTGNLATATTLDRPTETVMLAHQEAWREDLTILAQYQLKVSLGAANGKLREAMERRGVDPGLLKIRECSRMQKKDGTWQYVEAANSDKPDVLEVRCDFPAIREGDIPQLVTAVVTAMTLQNKGGEVVGVDEKEGIRKLGEILGLENNDETIEQMYPEGTGKDTYDRNRMTEILPPPIAKAKVHGGPIPEPAAIPQIADDAKLNEALARLKEALKDAPSAR